MSRRNRPVSNEVADLVNLRPSARYGRAARGVMFVASLAAGLPGSTAGQSSSRAGPYENEGSRPLVHQSWGISDGLPLSHANGVVATRQGYLWIATYDGLVRFDGARFTTFNASNRTDLPTSRFVSIHEDDTGALWSTGEFDHVVRFADGRFDVFSLPDEFRGGAIAGMAFGRNGAVWVSTNRGLFFVEGRRLMPARGLQGIKLAGDPYVDADGAVWVRTDGRGALRWRDGAFEAFTDDESVLGRVARGFAPAPDGGTYIATGGGIQEYRLGSSRPLRLPLPSPSITSIDSLSADTVLVTTNRGLIAVVNGVVSVLQGDLISRTTDSFLARDDDGGRWLSTDNRLYRNEQLVFESDIPIAGLAVDHEGSVWVAADGLHRFKPSLFDVVGKERGAFSNVYSILEDSRGRVWVGALGDGVGRFEGGDFSPVPSSTLSLAQSIAEDREGRIWVGLINYGGCILDGDACPLARHFLTGHTVKALYADTEGFMWVGTDRGVYRDSAGAWLHLSTDDGLPHDLVRVIEQTSDGAMWFGTNGGGIARYRDGAVESLSVSSGFPSDLIRDIHETSPGVLLIGTEDRGLLRLALEDASAPLSTADVLVVDRRAGLYDDGVHSIVDDGLGRLWMNTNRGIFWILEAQLEELATGQRTTIRSIAYREGDGLTNPEGNGGVQSAAIRASDGRLWFAMQAGVAIVDPRGLEASDYPLPILVEELRTENGRSIPNLSAASEPIELDPGERSFEIDYTALAFLAPQNLRFQYRLSGFQPDWVDASDRRTAFFTNVPAGEYRFHVRATREDGVWRELESPLLVAVNPYFHETVWFRSSLAAGLLLIGVGGVRVRDRRRVARERKLEELISERTATIEAQAAQLEEIDRTKSQFFANISHEFRTPLTLTIGPLEDLVSGQHGDLDAERLAPLQLSLRNSRRLLKLVNQLMEVAKLEAKAVEIRAREADVGPFVRELNQAFAPLAEREGIQTRVELPDGPVPLHFDPDLLERVMLNLLSNAFKFTPEGGTVAIEVSRHDDDWVTIAVRDSGPGIPEEQLPRLFDRFYQGDHAVDSFQPGTGIGLSLAKELVSLHGGRLEVESRTGFGSTFTVWLRSGADHFAADQLGDSDSTRAGIGPLVEEELALLETTRRPGDRDLDVEDDRARPTDDDIPTVLIVDDNVEVAAFIRSHLEGRFRCLEARDGEAALALTRKRLPDVVISDVMMPRMDGIEFLEALRADPDIAYVPVLLLTAKAGQDHKLEGLEAGAAAYLTKPFDAVELEARIEGLIEQQRVLRERMRREAILHASPPEVSTPADRFLLKLRETVEAHLADEDFDVRALARAMSESRSSLYRHIHDLTGETPSHVLKRMRLERAEGMLKAGAGSIQEIAYAVGFKSVSHFSRSFREEYGIPPSRYPEKR